MVLESRLHENNCFVTLTYSNEHLPADRSLNKHELQKFIKRLRKAKGELRYYACGEYGDLTKRAHYHACLFGVDFQHKIELKRDQDNVLYYSQELTDIWGLGHTSVAALTFETAAYCARYVLKKKTGLARGEGLTYYLDEETGELCPVVQPFALMSLRPAIAAQWLPQFKQDLYGADKDFLMLRGMKMKPPKYFDRLMDKIDPERIERIKKKRKEEREDKTIEELRAHEKITRARIIKKSKV